MVHKVIDLLRDSVADRPEPFDYTDQPFRGVLYNASGTGTGEPGPFRGVLSPINLTCVAGAVTATAETSSFVPKSSPNSTCTAPSVDTSFQDVLLSDTSPGPGAGFLSDGFLVKDSGSREQFSSGMVRDTTAGKTDYSLVFDGPMLERWAEHLTKGAAKYTKRNWMKANGCAEADRFKESAVRHFVQWMRGDSDEDHAAAIVFNINGYEYVTELGMKEESL